MRLCSHAPSAAMLMSMFVLWSSQLAAASPLVPWDRNSKRVVVLGSNMESAPEASLLPVTTLSWRRQGWTPLVLVTGEKWVTSRLGKRMVEELRRVPGCVVIHLSNKSSETLGQVFPLFASLLDEVDPGSYLLVADSRILSKNALDGILELGNITKGKLDIPQSTSDDGHSAEQFRLPSKGPQQHNRTTRDKCGSLLVHKVGAPAKVWARLAMKWLGLSSPPKDRDALVGQVLASFAHLKDELGASEVGSKILGCMVRPRAALPSHTLSHSDLDITNMTRPSWGDLFATLRQLEFMQPHDLDSLERYYWQTHPPACQSPSKASGKLFFFGVTCPQNHKLAAAAHLTWGRLIPNMTWFTTSAPIESNGAFPAVVLQTPRSSTGTYRADLITRMMAIWTYVSSTYSGFDWYVRCWDDNYIVGHRMAMLASHFKPSTPIAVGLTREFRKLPYLGGGATSLVSKKALHLVMRTFGSGLAKCRRLCVENKIYAWAEDVCFSLCSRQAGVREIHHCGFHTHHPFRKERKSMSKQDITCGMPWRRQLKDQPSCVYGPSFPGPITFHYVKKRSTMFLIHLLVTQKKYEFCDS